MNVDFPEPESPSRSSTFWSLLARNSSTYTVKSNRTSPDAFRLALARGGYRRHLLAPSVSVASAFANPLRHLACSERDPARSELQTAAVKSSVGAGLDPASSNRCRGFASPCRHYALVSAALFWRMRYQTLVSIEHNVQMLLDRRLCQCLVVADIVITCHIRSSSHTCLECHQTAAASVKENIQDL